MDKTDLDAIEQCTDREFARQVAADYREEAKDRRPSEIVDLLERAAAWQRRAEELEALAPAS